MLKEESSSTDSLACAASYTSTWHQLAELPAIRDLLEALLPYTERHFQRMNQLLGDSYIVDFTLQSMEVLE